MLNIQKTDYNATVTETQVTYLATNTIVTNEQDERVFMRATVDAYFIKNKALVNGVLTCTEFRKKVITFAQAKFNLTLASGVALYQHAKEGALKTGKIKPNGKRGQFEAVDLRLAKRVKVPAQLVHA